MAFYIASIFIGPICQPPTVYFAKDIEVGYFTHLFFFT